MEGWRSTPLTKQQKQLLIAVDSDGRNPGFKVSALGTLLSRRTADVRRSLEALEMRGLVHQLHFDDWRITNPGSWAAGRARREAINGK